MQAPPAYAEVTLRFDCGSVAGKVDHMQRCLMNTLQRSGRYPNLDDSSRGPALLASMPFKSSSALQALDLEADRVVLRAADFTTPPALCLAWSDVLEALRGSETQLIVREASMRYIHLLVPPAEVPLQNCWSSTVRRVNLITATGRLSSIRFRSLNGFRMKEVTRQLDSKQDFELLDVSAADFPKSPPYLAAMSSLLAGRPVGLIDTTASCTVAGLLDVAIHSAIYDAMPQTLDGVFVETVSEQVVVSGG